MTHQQRNPILATLLMAFVLCVGLLSACGQQQSGTEASSSDSSVAQETTADTATADEAAAGAEEATAADEAAATEKASASGEVDLAATFPSWNTGSESLAKLVAYVKGVTEEGGANYVAPEERLATFDMDGTLICEKAPVYVDYCMLMYRVLDDPTYEAPEEYVKTCEQLRANADKGIVDGDLDAAKNEAIAGAFEGMTPDEFHTYVNNFIDTANAEGFEGMTYGESVYKPMAEVIEYLRANEFDVYVVSACEREVARAIAVSKFGVSPDHVIGTDWGVKATGEGEDEAANEYTLSADDELVFDGTKDLEVAKLNKVVYIEREIGRCPLLAFGNSSGDYAMLNYAQNNPEHEGMGLLVLCDDTEREYGDLERATKQTGEAEEAGWTVFSMANDWATIYGENVVKTELPADAEQLAEAA